MKNKRQYAKVEWEECRHCWNHANRPFLSSKTVTVKPRTSVKTFLWKWILFAWGSKIIFMALHLALLWNRGLKKLPNSPLTDAPPLSFLRVGVVEWFRRLTFFFYTSLVQVPLWPLNGALSWYSRVHRSLFGIAKRGFTLSSLGFLTILLYNNPNM